jgi:hypothetical protein
MTNETLPPIDPRFDPAFQRGFDGSVPVHQSVPVRESVRAAAQRSRSVIEEPPPVLSPAPSRTVQPSPPGAAPAAAARAAAVRVAVSAPPPSEAPDISPAPGEFDSAVLTQGNDGNPITTPANSTRNPFLIALGVIALALIGIGIWLFTRSGAAFNSREVRSQGDYMSLDATIHMAPFISLLGVATAIGVIFVFATKWRRRR